MKANYYHCMWALLLTLMFPAHGVHAETIQNIAIAPVWSGHRVGFALLTHEQYQYVAYYDADRRMVVASRKLDDQQWEYVTLPESVVWDSHNYITMTMDDTQRLHISGNMHVDSLVYFRMDTPHDIHSIKRLKNLVGKDEDRMTYPRFFRGPNNEFIFTYRDGSSGSGNQIYTVYDAQAKIWKRLLDQPLTDGQGKMNAYIDGPRLGPDGRYHCVWVWRDTSDCATNHHVSYMRSNDLLHWENAAGEPLTLPVTIASQGTVVDPVPPGGGLINGNAKLGFDAQKRPIVSYHKYDTAGNSQIFNARWQNKVWGITPSTDWDTRWDFSGGGSIEFKVRVSPVRINASGVMTQDSRHWELGRRRWELNPETLAPQREIPIPKPKRPALSSKLQSTFTGMQVKTIGDIGRSPDRNVYYTLRWETLGPHRDLPREKPWPEPSMLVLQKHRR